MNKEQAVLSAIRNADVGSDIIIHNKNMQVWCVLRVICKEHNEDRDGGCVARVKRGGNS